MHMHDIDRALFEQEQWSGENEYETYGEQGSYGEQELYGEQPMFGEAEDENEVALVTELLEVGSEAELDRFLGNLLSSAVSAAKGFANSAAGKAVGGVLKGVAKQALPQLGRLAGNALVPGVGGDFGAKAGQWLGSRLELGLEMEGLSAEDREFETARAFVRFGQETAQRAAQAARTTPDAPPVKVAQQAAVSAARAHLPGLLQQPSPNGSPSATGRSGGGSGSGAASGRWVRRGRRIVLLDV
jgi:hypothetical protein